MSWLLDLAEALSIPNSDGFFYPIPIYVEPNKATTMSVVTVDLEAQLNHYVSHLSDLCDAQMISDHSFNITLLGSVYRSDAPLEAFVDPCLGVNTTLGILVDDILCLPVNTIRSPDVCRVQVQRCI